MELQKTKHELRLEEWKNLVYTCRSSGKTIATWCGERGISVQTYYRWQKQVWERMTEQGGTPSGKTSSKSLSVKPEVHFAEYRSVDEAKRSAESIVVHLSCGSVEIPSGADKETVAATLQALGALC